MDIKCAIRKVASRGRATLGLRHFSLQREGAWRHERARCLGARVLSALSKTRARFADTHSLFITIVKIDANTFALAPDSKPIFFLPSIALNPYRDPLSMLIRSSIKHKQSTRPIGPNQNVERTHSQPSWGRDLKRLLL